MRPMTEIHTDNRAPLEVGVVLGSSIQPAWIRDVLGQIRASLFASLKWVSITEGSTAAQKRSADRTHALVRRYQLWDAEKYRRETDACAAEDIDTPTDHSHTCCFPRLGADAASDTKVDIVIAFAMQDCPAKYSALSRLGAWTVSIGQCDSGLDDYAGFWEVLDHAPVTKVALWSRNPQDGSRSLLSQSSVSTNLDSPYRNRNACCLRAAALVVRQLEKAQLDIPADRGGIALGSESGNDGCGVAHTGGGLSRLIRHCANIAARRLSARAYKDQWFMAYKFEAMADDCTENLANLTPIIPPADRFWADPFPIEHQGRHYIFFEEATYQPRLGHISVMELKPDGTYTEPKAVLERSYHISYPYLLSYGESLLMIPETYANNSVDLYECTAFPDQWQLHSTLMPDTRAVDSTLFEYHGRWWLFAAMGSEEAAFNEELCVFYSDSPFGPWAPHLRNPVISDARCARPAGRPFTCGERLMRPAQNCSRGIYGRALSIREIVRLSPEVYEEREAYGFEPDWCKGITATHTLNRAGNLLVVDGRRLVRRP